MGDQVKLITLAAAVAASLLSSAAGAAGDSPQQAVASDIFYSSDAEHTEVLKLGFDLDWLWNGPEDREGLRLERDSYKPLGGREKRFDRAYLDAAGPAGRWKWVASAGTDGHTIVGSADVHNDQSFRQEYFLERDIVETPIGVRHRIYYTFGGASLDVPADPANIFTVFAGLQAFTGGNLRTHLRANFVHVIAADWGLTAQVRTRYFRDSDPHQFDYYSPRWYAEVLPVLQVRRFVGGWQLLAAAGYGAQRDSDSRWRASRYFNARFTSPAFRKDWAATGGILYSNTPVSSGFTYRYLQFNLGLTKAF